MTCAAASFADALLVSILLGAFALLGADMAARLRAASI
jgi:hypothetical protein